MARNEQTFRLTILLVTYNHEKYITKALTSLFNQNLNEPIELIIADDSSTDNTLKIIKSFEGIDERFHFKYLDNQVNLGITKNYQRGFAACSGEFIAVLEGDDIWIRTYKLEQQLNFLTSHMECDLCSVNYLIFDEQSAKITSRLAVDQGFRYIDAPELIKDNIIGNFSTCLYRASAIHALPAEIFDICTYDWLINIIIARNGPLGFLKEPMSLYRLHHNGAWSQNNHLQKLKLQLNLLPVYDKVTQGCFHQEFNALARHLKRCIKLNQIKDKPLICLFYRVGIQIPLLRKLL